MIINTEAIVLNSKKFGDTSRIVSLYTKESGSISVVAKGARKPNSKFGSSLEPLSYSFISYYHSPHSNLHLLSKSEICQPLRRLHESYDHLSAGLMIVESIAQTQEEAEKNELLFELLSGVIVLLNEQKHNPYSIFVSFQIRLAQILGFELNLKDSYEMFSPDGNTGREVMISLDDATLNSPSSTNKVNMFRMSIRNLELLTLLSELPPAESYKVIIDDQSRTKITEFFAQYFSYHLDKRISFRTFNFMEK